MEKLLDQDGDDEDDDEISTYSDHIELLEDEEGIEAYHFKLIDTTPTDEDGSDDGLGTGDVEIGVSSSGSQGGGAATGGLSLDVGANVSEEMGEDESVGSGVSDVSDLSGGVDDKRAKVKLISRPGAMVYVNGVLYTPIPPFKSRYTHHPPLLPLRIIHNT